MNATRHTLANALRVAAEQYMSAAHSASCLRSPDLEEQFTRHAKHARDLADAIDQADAIRLGEP